MDDAEYEASIKKLETYIPLLVNLIQRLESSRTSEGDNPRQAQLTKMKTLYDVLTTRDKKLKPENLKKCESLLSKLKQKSDKAKDEKNDPVVEKSAENNESETNDLTSNTPRSPKLSSVVIKPPVIIPTERTFDSTDLSYISYDTNYSHKGYHKHNDEPFRRRSPKRSIPNTSNSSMHSSDLYDPLEFYSSSDRYDSRSYNNSRDSSLEPKVSVFKRLGDKLDINNYENFQIKVDNPLKETDVLKSPPLSIDDISDLLEENQREDLNAKDIDELTLIREKLMNEMQKEVLEKYKDINLEEKITKPDKRETSSQEVKSIPAKTPEPERLAFKYPRKKLDSRKQDGDYNPKKDFHLLNTDLESFNANTSPINLFKSPDQNDTSIYKDNCATHNSFGTPKINVDPRISTYNQNTVVNPTLNSSFICKDNNTPSPKLNVDPRLKMTGAYHPEVNSNINLDSRMVIPPLPHQTIAPQLPPLPPLPPNVLPNQPPPPPPPVRNIDPRLARRQHSIDSVSIGSNSPMDIASPTQINNPFYQPIPTQSHASIGGPIWSNNINDRSTQLNNFSKNMNSNTNNNMHSVDTKTEDDKFRFYPKLNDMVERKFYEKSKKHSGNEIDKKYETSRSFEKNNSSFKSSSYDKNKKYNSDKKTNYTDVKKSYRDHSRDRFQKPKSYNNDRKSGSYDRSECKSSNETKPTQSRFDNLYKKVNQSIDKKNNIMCPIDSTRFKIPKIKKNDAIIEVEQPVEDEWTDETPIEKPVELNNVEDDWSEETSINQTLIKQTPILTNTEDDWLDEEPYEKTVTLEKEEISVNTSKDVKELEDTSLDINETQDAKKEFKTDGDTIKELKEEDDTKNEVKQALTEKVDEEVSTLQDEKIEECKKDQTKIEVELKPSDSKSNLNTQSEPPIKSPDPEQSTSNKTNPHMLKGISTVLNLFNLKPTMTKDGLLKLLETCLDEKKFAEVKLVLEKPDDVDEEDKFDQDRNESPVGETAKESDQTTEEKENSTEQNDENVKETEEESDKAEEPKSKKRLKRLNELQKLNEDIRQMFICEGVLTSTGRRVCHILAENKMSENTTSTKPIEKSKENDANNKAPTKKLVKPKIIQKKKTVIPAKNRRTTRSTLTQKNLAKLGSTPKKKVIDNANVKTVSKKITVKGKNIVKKVQSSDDNSSDSENETLSETASKLSSRSNSTSTKISRDKTPERIVSRRAPVRRGQISPPKVVAAATKNKKPVPKGKRKRKLGNWASGIITKKPKANPIKKKEAPSKKETKSKTQLRNTDKSYHSNSTKHVKCLFCDFNGRWISHHYACKHPENENFASRLSVEKAKEVKSKTYVRRSSKSTNATGNTTKYFFKCHFCDVECSWKESDWINHLTSHTGEYIFRCMKCNFVTSQRTWDHKNCSGKLVKRNDIKFKSQTLYGYMCSDCNFLQIQKSNLENHIKVHHTERIKPKIIEIEMVNQKMEKESDYEKNDQFSDSEKGAFVPQDDSDDEAETEKQSSKEKQRMMDNIVVPLSKAKASTSIADRLNQRFKRPVSSPKLRERTRIESPAEQSKSPQSETNDNHSIRAPGSPDSDSTVILKQDSEDDSSNDENDDNDEWEDIESESETDKNSDISQVTNELSKPGKKGNLISTLRRLYDSINLDPATGEISRKIEKRKTKDNSDSIFKINKKRRVDFREILREKQNTSNAKDKSSETDLLKEEDIKEEIDPETVPSVQPQISTPPPLQISEFFRIDRIGCHKKGLENALVYEYTCLFENCLFKTLDKGEFIDHLNTKESEYWDGYCYSCEAYIKTDENMPLHVEFKHLLDVHVRIVAPIEVNFGPPSRPLLSLRKLPGDLLSASTVQGQPENILNTQSKPGFTPIPLNCKIPSTLKIVQIPNTSASGTAEPTIKKVTPIKLTDPKVIQAIKHLNSITTLRNVPTNATTSQSLISANSTITTTSATTYPQNIVITIPNNQISLLQPSPRFVPIQPAPTLAPNLQISSIADGRGFSTPVATIPSVKLPVTLKTPTPVPANDNTVIEQIEFIHRLKPWTKMDMFKTDKACNEMLEQAPLFKLYKCMAMHCSYTTREKLEFLKHLREHEKYAEDQLTINPMDLDTTSWLECSYCKTFADTCNDLVNHVVSEHEESIFQCSKCFYRSVTATNVLFHFEFYHLDVPKFILVTMMPEKNVSNMPSIIRNRNINVRPLHCHIDGCTKLFYGIDIFAKHLVEHQSSDYPCTYCPLVVPKSSALKHLNCHGIGLFECIYCLFGTNNFKLLKQHITDNHCSSYVFMVIRFLRECLNVTMLQHIDSVYFVNLGDCVPYAYLIAPNFSFRSLSENIKPKNLPVRIIDSSCLYTWVECKDIIEKKLSSMELNNSTEDLIPASIVKNTNTTAISNITPAFASGPVISMVNLTNKDNYNLPIFSVDTTDRNLSTETPVKTPTPIFSAVTNKSNYSQPMINADVTGRNQSPITPANKPAAAFSIVTSNGKYGIQMINTDVNEKSSFTPTAINSTVAHKDRATATITATYKSTPVNKTVTPTISSALVGMKPAKLQKVMQAKEMREHKELQKDIDKAIHQLICDMDARTSYSCLYDNCYTISRTLVQLNNHLLSHESRASKRIQCFICDKVFKNISSLIQHIKCHRFRFLCYFCAYKSFVAHLAFKHVTAAHKCKTTRMLSLNPERINKSCDVFVIGSDETTEEDIFEFGLKHVENFKIEQNKNKKVFDPSEADLLPRVAIFTNDITCSVCNYSTKVCKNMYRHLIFHRDEVPVPSVDPVNPVPCLNATEKHFDRMLNPACSSQSDKSSHIDAPKFVIEIQRFVCGAKDCQYLTCNEEMLICHLDTLHPNDTYYRCPHCAYEYKNIKLNSEKIMEHLRLHESNLYKCSKCENFYSNQRGVINHHAQEVHQGQCDIYVVREEATIKNTSDDVKWECKLCKYTVYTRKQIIDHCHEKHQTKSQYQCGICGFRSSNQINVSSHCNHKHKNCPEDIRIIFGKVGDDSLLVDNAPLWRRDENKIKHIRGILFEDEEEQIIIPSDDSDNSSDYSSSQSNGIHLCVYCNFSAPYNELKLHHMEKHRHLQITKHTTASKMSPVPHKDIAIFYVCIYCPKRAETVEKMKQHWKERHNANALTHLNFRYKISKLASCYYCNTSIAYHELYAHITKRHAKPFAVNNHLDTRTCGDCDYIYLSDNDLIQHYKCTHLFQVTSAKVFPDDLKHKEIVSKYIDTIVSLFVCMYCSMESDSVEELENHHYSEHQEHRESNIHPKPQTIIYGCYMPTCKETNKEEIAMVRHIQRHLALSNVKHNRTAIDFVKEVHRFNVMKVIFPNGLVLTKGDLINTKYGSYDEIKIKLTQAGLTNSIKAAPRNRRSLTLVEPKHSFKRKLTEVDDSIKKRRASNDNTINESPATMKKEKPISSRHCDAEFYSFYKKSKDDIDLNKIYTTMNIDGNNMRITCAKLADLVNLNPILSVEMLSPYNS